MTREEYEAKLDELLDSAAGGNISAMEELGDLIYNSNQSYNGVVNALPWYERAANLGSAYGTIQSMAFYGVLLDPLKKSRDFDKLEDYSKKVISYASKLMDADEVGQKIVDSAVEHTEDASYACAFAQYCMRKYDAAYQCLKSVGDNGSIDRIPMAAVLTGVCAMRCNDFDTAFNKLRILEGPLASILPDLDDNLDQVILNYACLNYSTY